LMSMLLLLLLLLLLAVFARFTPSPEDWEKPPDVHAQRLDSSPHLCVDQATPPVLVIEGDHPMVLELGQTYVEHGVKVRP
jgi:hypothetical protein